MSTIREVITRVVLTCTFSGPLSLTTGSSSAYHLAAGFEEFESLLHEGATLCTKLTRLVLTESVEAAAQSTFIGKGTRNLTLKLGFGLTDDACIVDQTVFWGVLLRFESTE